jgi:putative hydrolase of the HAD superfamily
MPVAFEARPGGPPSELPGWIWPRKQVSIEAFFFDLGGVILRTEFEAPREQLAERLDLSYEELVRMVFESEGARQASLGRITTQQHWEGVAARLGRPTSEVAAMRDEFFGGDLLDRQLLDLIRSLRPTRRTGLISNGWPDLRDYVVKNKFDDAFDTLIISAEVGLLKPDPRIYELALRTLGASAAQSVLVDDTPANLKAATAMGMRGILFSNPDQVRLELAPLIT